MRRDGAGGGAAGGGRCVRAQAKGAINQEAVDLAPGFWFLRDVSPFARLAFKVAFLSIPLPTPHALTARQAPRCSNTPARPGSHSIFGLLPATPDSDSAGWPPACASPVPEAPLILSAPSFARLPFQFARLPLYLPQYHPIFV